jgi:hypothetical protein
MSAVRVFPRLAETRDWLSFERDRHRMANFGTRSVSGGTAVAPDPTPTSLDQESHGHGNGSTVVDVTDTAWKEGLQAGDLVDAQDSTGVWYQVRTGEFL